MDKEKGIIIFTKDRPEILSKTLPQLLNIDLPVIVLDDSVDPHTETTVKSIAKNGQNIYYHGKIDQQRILQKFAETNYNLNSFVKPLGGNGWTLGYARNYAIILAKTYGFGKVLFMDDDIIIEDNSIIYSIFDLLDDSDFVSAEIKGMPDLSVVDHIMQKLGLKPYRFMSGGFLAFKLNSVSEYFLNYYNEDWVWLFLHKPKAKLTKYGGVYQLPYDPFENAVEKALQQEFGEILVEGVINAISENNSSLLKSITFWDGILKKCKTNLERLKELCDKKDFEIGTITCSALLEYHRTLNPKKFVKVFDQYFNERICWLNLIKNGGMENVR